MRGQQRAMRNLYFARGMRTKQGTDVIMKYDTPIAFYCAVMPETSRAAQDMYGTRLPNIKRMLSATATLKQGDGVWIDADINAEPDYRVIAVYEYHMTREYQVEKRGVYGG